MAAYLVLDTPFEVYGPRHPLGRVLYTKYPSPSNLSLVATAKMTKIDDLAATAQMTKTNDEYPPMEILMTEYRAPPTLEGPPSNFSPYH